MGASHTESDGREPLDLSSAQRLLAALGETQGIPEEARPTAGDPVMVGPYRLERLLGAGATGDVHVARREGGERRVALKLLHRDAARGQATAHYWREVDLLSQLRLECVPRLLDYGFHDGRAYVVTEHINGEALDAHCSSHDLTREARVRLLADVAAAVQRLHEHGLIHRDIKPSNVLVNTHGQPVIIDLGVASLAACDHATTLTTDGAPIGSPAFMSPEQARGDAAAVSTRSDVYALGATAMFVLTGATPHDLTGASLFDAVRKVGHEPARDPHAIDPTLPRALASVLGKALRERPQDRYATAGDFAADLRRWLAGEPVLAAPPSMWVRLTRAAGRHPLVTTAAACVMLAVSTLAATTISVWWWNMQPHRIALSEDGRLARLLARSGREIAAWESTVDGYILAELIDWPAERGGGKAVVLADAHHVPAGEGGDVVVWRLDDLGASAWSGRLVVPAPAPPPPWGEAGESYHLSEAWVVDVFEESAGAEIVTSWSEDDHPRVIRIFSVAGSLLFEAWHYGAVNDALWLPDAGRLVLAGIHGEPLWGTQADDPTAPLYPKCVLAVEPRLGERWGWISETSTDERAHPKWHKVAWPREISDFVEIATVPPRFEDLRGSHVGVDISLYVPGGSKSWTLDSEGNPLPEPFSSLIVDGLHEGLRHHTGGRVKAGDVQLVNWREIVGR
jgi:hypothetical protein